MNKPDNISTKDWDLLKEKYPNNLEKVINKIKKGYPIQYLIGNVEFLNTTINVDKRVLIPRFETEYLVYKIIEKAKETYNEEIKIADLGTGSGCIAIALKKEIKCEVDAFDISKKAIKLAKENAKENKVQINFFCQNIKEPLNDNYDIIVSNPPYIKSKKNVDKRVLKYEPHLALFAKEEGIYYYKKIINNNFKKLNKPGIMAFEIGDNQEEILTKFLSQYKSIRYEFIKDLTKRTRYLFIYNE